MCAAIEKPNNKINTIRVNNLRLPADFCIVLCKIAIFLLNSIFRNKIIHRAIKHNEPLYMPNSNSRKGS